MMTADTPYTFSCMENKGDRCLMSVKKTKFAVRMTILVEFHEGFQLMEMCLYVKVQSRFCFPS